MVLAFSKLRSQISLSALFHLNGSVFPFATKVALPCAAAAFVLKLAQVEEWPMLCELLDKAAMDSTVYNAFSTLLGILVVFRTGQAYNRFWDGSTLTHQMRGDWFDAASSIISFTRTSKADSTKLWEFRQIVVRLFSMLHALSLAELEDDDDEDEERWAFRLRVIDGVGIDVDSLRALKKAECKVELVFHWIQSIVVTSIDCGIMSAPSPILTRAYSELASGMVKFHDCLKIARIAVPFPYSQATLMLLVIHWLLTPFMMTLGTESPTICCVFTFVTVFILWVLHSISIELENPFGADANDLDVHDVQHDMNNRLLLLLDPISAKMPTLSGNQVMDHELLLDMERNREMPAFDTMWRNLAGEVEQGGDLKRGRRSSTQLRRGSFVARKSSSQISLNTYMGKVSVMSFRGPRRGRGEQSPGLASDSSCDQLDGRMSSTRTEAMVDCSSGPLDSVKEEESKSRKRSEEQMGVKVKELEEYYSSYGLGQSESSPHLTPSVRATVTTVTKTMEDWEDEARRAPKVGHLWQVPAETKGSEDWETDEPRVGMEVPQRRRSSHLIIGVAGI